DHGLIWAVRAVTEHYMSVYPNIASLAVQENSANLQLRRWALRRALSVLAWVVTCAVLTCAADSKKLTVRLLDGQPIAARVSVIGSDGKPYAPPESILRQPEGATPYFYADGKFVVTLPPGVARLELWRGVEYLPERVDVDLQSDAEIAVRL